MNSTPNPAGNSLPSWNQGKTKKSILNFVAKVTDTGSPDFVGPEARVAVFDNDGTLWCEQPMPIQADFLFRKLAKMAADHPGLREKQPWKAVVERDFAWLGGAITKHYNGDDSALKEMGGGLLQAYEGMTIEEYERETTAFFQSGTHPVLKRPYLKCAYRPMIELLAFLAANGFTNYISSGGGRDFMRPVTLDLYGIPPERVVGSSVSLGYRDDGETCTIFHRPELDVLNDGPAKVVSIWGRIGRRPIFAAGNSNGDVPMMHFCAQPARPSFCLLLKHDDEDREFSYQTGAEDALKRAEAGKWTVISMKSDWKDIFI